MSDQVKVGSTRRALLQLPQHGAISAEASTRGILAYRHARSPEQWRQRVGFRTTSPSEA
jgi:hypothetical protein